MSSAIKYSDEQLMREVLKGNRQSFELLYDRYFDKLVWFARQFLGDAHLAEDMVQEVFMKIIEQPQAFDAEQRFSTWIYTLTANRCKNLLRNEQNRLTLLEQQQFADTTHMHHRIDEGFYKEAIATVIDGCSDKEKTLFVLRFEHDMPIKEISRVTEMPEGSVKSGIYYLLKKLTKKIKQLTDEDR